MKFDEKEIHVALELHTILRLLTERLKDIAGHVQMLLG